MESPPSLPIGYDFAHVFVYISNFLLLLIFRKNILMNMSESIKTYSVQCTQLADALSSSMNKIKEDNPYEPFIVNKGYFIIY